MTVLWRKQILPFGAIPWREWRLVADDGQIAEGVVRDG